jgi:biopolymer transport protein ExbD
MNFRRGREREEIDINLIPLIDILIVVLIFLFLTTTYSRYAELQINLPEAAAEKASDKPQTLNIAVDAQRQSTRSMARRRRSGARRPSPRRCRDAAKGRAGAPVVAISADAAADAPVGGST